MRIGCQRLFHPCQEIRVVIDRVAGSEVDDAVMLRQDHFHHTGFEGFAVAHDIPNSLARSGGRLIVAYLLIIGRTNAVDRAKRHIQFLGYQTPHGRFPYTKRTDKNDGVHPGCLRTYRFALSCLTW